MSDVTSRMGTTKEQVSDILMRLVEKTRIMERCEALDMCEELQGAREDWSSCFEAAVEALYSDRPKAHQSLDSFTARYGRAGEPGQWPSIGQLRYGGNLAKYDFRTLEFHALADALKRVAEASFRVSRYTVDQYDDGVTIAGDQPDREGGYLVVILRGK